MFTIVGNGHVNTSSNSGRNFAFHIMWERDKSNYSRDGYGENGMTDYYYRMTTGLGEKKPVNLH